MRYRSSTSSGLNGGALRAAALASSSRLCVRAPRLFLAQQQQGLQAAVGEIRRGERLALGELRKSGLVVRFDQVFDVARNAERNCFDFTSREWRAAVTRLHRALKLPCRLLQGIETDVKGLLETLATLEEAKGLAVGAASRPADAFGEIALGIAQIAAGIRTMASGFDLVIKRAFDVIQRFRGKRGITHGLVFSQ